MEKRKPQKRNPTNAEILLEVRELRKRIDPLADRVNSLEQTRRDETIAKSAITEYLKDNPPPKLTSPAGATDQWLNRELVKTLGIALAVILALVELLVQLKGLAVK